MQGLFKYFRLTPVGDNISDCAKGLKDLKRLKTTYPPEAGEKDALSINLKA